AQTLTSRIRWPTTSRALWTMRPLAAAGSVRLTLGRLDRVCRWPIRLLKRPYCVGEQASRTELRLTTHSFHSASRIFIASRHPVTRIRQRLCRKETSLVQATRGGMHPWFGPTIRERIRSRRPPAFVRRHRHLFLSIGTLAGPREYSSGAWDSSANSPRTC